MSSKTIVAVVAAAVACLAIGLLVILSSGSSQSAKLSVIAGQPGQGGLRSTLECDGDKASGTGLFSRAKAAQDGCRQVEKVKTTLTGKQAACPRRSLDGAPVYRLTGEVDGKPVSFETFQNTCSQRLDQFARLTPLIKSMQASVQPPKLQVMISPPPPPALTAEDIKETEQLIQRLGWKGYQRYMKRQGAGAPGPRAALKACPKPLPRDFFSPCLLTIQPRPDETDTQALRRVKTEHPEWFRNDGPDTPPLPPAARKSPIPPAN